MRLSPYPIGKSGKRNAPSQPLPVGIDVLVGVEDNVKKNADVDEFVVDGIVDTAISVGEIAFSGVVGAGAGFLVGTFAGPGMGNVVGAVVGFATGVVSAVGIDLYEDENGESRRDKWKDEIYDLYKSKR